MSSEALSWAFKLNIKPASVKFTLVALCECANYKTGRINPSVAHVAEITGQDRKTIIANIATLARMGVLEDTGERVGRTGQVKVYKALMGTVPKAEQSQKRNSSVSPRKESQKRDTEPSREPSNSCSNEQPTRAKGWPEIPDWMPVPEWNGFVAMRQQNRKKPTVRAVQTIIEKLDRWRAKGHDPGAILDASTECGWTTVYEPKERRNGNGNSNSNTADLARQKLGLAVG